MRLLSTLLDLHCKGQAKNLLGYYFLWNLQCNPQILFDWASLTLQKLPINWLHNIRHTSLLKQERIYEIFRFEGGCDGGSVLFCLVFKLCINIEIGSISSPVSLTKFIGVLKLMSHGMSILNVVDFLFFWFFLFWKIILILRFKFLFRRNT